MLKFFRNIFKSRLGLLITLGFLALIALAFVVGDVAGTNTFGGVAGGDRVAVVGKSRLSTSELSRAATQALERARQQDPTLTMQAFIAQGGLDQVLNQMVDRLAIAEYARQHGFRAGDNLINSEIRKIAAFRGPDGNFSPEVYKNALAAQGLTDAIVREDLAKGLLAQVLLEPATAAMAYPKAAADRYAQLFKERRIGSIAFLPAAAFAPATQPDQATLERFYQTARARFVRPEERTIRFAEFGTEAVAGKIAPTPAAIAARYERDKASYAAREERSFTQLIVPTQAAAEAIRKRVAEGGTLEAAAQGAGLRTSALAAIDRNALKAQSSEAVAAAYFGAARGAVTAPARSALGWHIARIDSVSGIAGQTLAQASPAITTALTRENEARALADLSAEVEQQLDEGATLPEIAQSLKLTVRTAGPLTADGRPVGGGAPPPAIVLPALQTAFQMEESAPQLGQVPQTERFVIYEVTRIVPAAAPPLAQIRPQLVAAWRQAEGAKAARAAADRVAARLAKGEALGAALAAEKAGGAPEAVNLSREELAARRTRVPSQLALFFSMAQGTSKVLAAPSDGGAYVVDLDRIEVGKLAPNDPLAQQARRELAGAMTAELSQQAVAAMRKAVGAEINAAGVAAVRRQLTGGN